MKKLILSAACALALTSYAAAQTTATQVAATTSTAKENLTTTAVTTETGKKQSDKTKNKRKLKAMEQAPQENVKISVPTPVINYTDNVPASARKQD